MANLKSFSDIINYERDRKKSYIDIVNSAEKKLCLCCKQNIVNNGGMSRVDGICNNCVSKSLKDNY